MKNVINSLVLAIRENCDDETLQEIIEQLEDEMAEASGKDPALYLKYSDTLDDLNAPDGQPTG